MTVIVIIVMLVLRVDFLSSPSYFWLLISKIISGEKTRGERETERER